MLPNSVYSKMGDEHSKERLVWGTLVDNADGSMAIRSDLSREGPWVPSGGDMAPWTGAYSRAIEDEVPSTGEAL